MKKFLATAFLTLSTILIALFFLAPTQYVVPVLMYHSIDKTYEEPLNNVSTESFLHQMDYLKKNGYRVIPVLELVDGIKAGKKFDTKTVAITFDDGIQNNYTNAYPILKARHMPAALFIPTELIGTPGRLTWEQIREMAENGFTVGSHMLTGAYWPDEHGQQLVREIVDSKKTIEAKIGRPVYFLAYPIGGFMEEAKPLLRQAGYKAAFTTNRGFNRNNRDLFELKRIRVKDADSDLVFRAKVSGYYNFFRGSKKPY